MIVIAIPTFRRLDLLAKLLGGLVPQAAAVGATILVGDNACEEAVAQHVKARSSAADIHYIPVPQRGVSQVRNALVAEATIRVPHWRWLLMLDDDGQVTPGWLNTIVACGDEYQADLIGGPVTGALPQDSSRLARNSVFAERKRWPTGPVALLNTTQNLGISRSVLNLLPTPLFAATLGASGGEDYDLFRRAVRAGGRLVWCDEAEILEPAPSERLSTYALLHRYYSTGVYMAPIDAGYDGLGKGVTVALKGLAGSMARAGIDRLSGRLDNAAHSTLMTAHYAGRIAGLIGVRSARYVNKEDSKP